jgi:hypothetical protein
VLTKFSKQNLGCKTCVSSGLDWVFKQVEEAIILEHDCVPDITFFSYCQEMLNKFRHDNRVLMISGTNLAWDLPIKESYYLSRYPHIWGWASWRRSWKSYDVNMEDLPQLLANKSFINSFRRKSEYLYWSRVLCEVREGRVDTWDAQIVYLAFSNSQLTVYPSGNLITNIGFNANATHTKERNKLLANLPLVSFKWEDCDPKIFLPHYEAEKKRKLKEGIGINKYIKFIMNFKRK